MASRGRGLTRMLLAALLCASSLQFATPARARTFTVCPSGCNFTTIAAALQAAGDRDEISIGAGTYAGGFVVEKNVHLQGAGRDETTIRGTSSASAIRVRSGANVAISHVTITGGGGDRPNNGVFGGGGIYNEGELRLVESAVRGNTLSILRGRGGGILSNSTKPLVIFGSEISGNEAHGGGGIYIHAGEVKIVGTTISGNRSGESGGGIRHDGSGKLDIKQSVISDNEAADAGGGVVVEEGPSFLFDSTVSGNSAAAGGGVAGGDKRLRVLGSIISDNDAGGGRGGGVLSGRGGVLFDHDSEVRGNTSREGAGVYTGSGDVVIDDSTIAGNVAAEFGGGISSASAEITLNRSNVVDNRAGTAGGGIYLDDNGELRLDRATVISGNQPDQCFPAAEKC